MRCVVSAHLPADLAELIGVDRQEPVESRFSPGVAVRCDGQRFVKAVDGARFPYAARLHRSEAEVLRRLATSDVPHARLVHVVEHGAWVALVLEEVVGRHVELPAELALLPDLPGAPTGLAAWRLPDEWGGWSAVLAAEEPAVAELAAGWGQAAAGDRLVHGDLRADNVMVGDDGRAVLVDWAWACRGAPWLDRVMLAPTVSSRPWELVDQPDEVIGPVVAALALLWTGAGRQPDPPGIPAVRAAQRTWGAAAMAWTHRVLR
jgi:aminoglycoside phosphotransferase (APT) family kinase protein